MKDIMKWFCVLGCSIAVFVPAGLLRAANGHSESETLPFPPIACSMSFYDVSVRNLLKTFAEEHGFNIILAEGIERKVSINLSNITLADAFKSILSVAGLDYIVQGSIIEVDTYAKINAKLESKNRKLDYLKKNADLSINIIPRETRIFRLKYTVNPRPTIARDMPREGTMRMSLDDLAASIKNEALSPRGSIDVLDDKNSIMVTDVPSALDRVAAIIAELDVAPPQIGIEARIVDITDDFVKELGVQWGGSYSRGDFLTTGGQRTDVEEGGAVEDTGPSTQGVGLSGDSYVVNMPATVGVLQGASIGFLLTDGENFNLDLQLSALEEDKKLEVISRPRVITLDNQRAYIESGQEIPYKDYESEVTGGFSIEFKKAALQMEVTPHVLEGGEEILLDIVVAEKSANYSQAIFLGGEPPIDTRSLTTRVIINNSDTVVIGGLKRDSTQETLESVPFFGRLPVLKWFFRYEKKDTTESQLMIFLTPTILEIRGGASDV